MAPGLTVKTDDPLAPLELLHADGTPATDGDGRSRIGLGTLECYGLEPGYYRVRLDDPRRPASPSSTVEVVAGDDTAEFTLPAPRVETSGLMRDLADRVGLKTNDKNFFELSEKLAAVVAPACLDGPDAVQQRDAPGLGLGGGRAPGCGGSA